MADVATLSGLGPTAIPRSSMFVPGDRADLLAKSARFGADALVADLEDAVAVDNKDAALDTIEEWLELLAQPSVPCPAAWVRINTGDRGRHEIARLSRFTALVGVFVPKVESALELGVLRRATRNDLRLAPMIESATGLVHVVEIAQAPGVHQLHIGELDLATDLGLTPGADGAELAYARAQVVVASRHADLVAPAAPVSPRFDDRAAYWASTEALARMGFIGRDCIHPAQVEVANAIFSPDVDEIAWANSVLDEAQRRPGSYRGADGSMVDAAVLRRARSVLARSAPAIASSERDG